MSIKEIKEKLTYLITSCPRKWSQSLRKAPKYAELYNTVLEHSKDSQGLTLSARVYWFLNDIHQMPLCSVCHSKSLAHVRCHPLRGYATDCCSMKCRVQTASYKASMEKIKQKNLKKYGVEHIQQSSQYRQKIRKILAKRTLEQQKTINEKRKQTCLKKYGVEFAAKNEKVKEKASKTFKSKTKEELAEIQERTRQTLIKRYGEDYKHVIFKNFHNITQIIKSYNRVKQRKDVQILCSQEEFIEKRIQKIYTFKYKCLKCGNTFSAKGLAPACPWCEEDNVCVSNLELELRQFIMSSTSVAIESNTRSVIYPLELDIWIPEKKLAIEFDGMYWHSDQQKPKNYHVNKTNECQKKGIQLIHVFENEWRLKQDIVKQMLLAKLGIFSHSISAECCAVKQISSRESLDFQEKNSIQNAIGGNVHLGLFYEDELVQTIVFSSSRKYRRQQWEIACMCIKLGWNIDRGFQKILEFFEQSYSPIDMVVSIDRRWFTASLIDGLGFTYVKTTAPVYWYFLNNDFNLHSWMKFQKHNLKSLLAVYDESKTEVQNMRANGYNRIFDCGNLIFEKKLNNIV